MNVFAPMRSSRLADNFIAKAPYLSAEFAAAERERLWPTVWLVACREEEVSKPGRYVTFDIADDSIIVSRDGGGRLRAFHNACQHRGRRLTDGCGFTAKFLCKYHGWRWNLDGSNDAVIDREDWEGSLSDADVRLKDVQVATWGGFVFVNMEKDAEPLESYLAPVMHAFRNFRLESMRYHWYKSVILPCNWKVALDVFIEGYHAQTAHRQSNAISGDNRYECELFGPHSVFRNRAPVVIGEPGPNFDKIGGVPEDNARFASLQNLAAKLAAYFQTLHDDLDCMLTPRFMRAVARMAEAAPADADYDTLMGMLYQYHLEEGSVEGVNWDHLPLEDLIYLGMDWHVFPNVAMLPTADAVLAYRARPWGKDPDQCRLDVWSLARFPEGQEPSLEREFYERWEDAQWPRIFTQDFENVGAIQTGMKSRGYEGGRANPIAEATVANFHQELRRRVLGGD
jgi:phenylpropionate dioxygenase-like ring-hydroxylating dioxygenase large terminal subunit